MATEIYVPNHAREIEVHSVDSRVHLRLRMPAQISGVDLNGQNFVELAHTVLVAPSGAVLGSKRSLGPDQELTVKLGKKEILARVLGIAGPGESTYVYGICFMQPDITFWGVGFPKAAAVKGGTAATFVQCGHCGAQRSYLLNEVESLVLQESGSFGLYCSVCKDGTLWRLAESAAPSRMLKQEESGLAIQEPAVTLATTEQEDVANVHSLATAIITAPNPAKRKNQRKHLRVGVAQAKACVRRPDGEEIVELLNLSCGGALLRSQSVYPLGAWIRLAAPCTVGGDNIFVLARIVRVEATDLGREYGVQYVHH